MKCGVFLAAPLLLAACATPRPSPAPTKIELAGGLSVSPIGTWTHITDAHDGPITKGDWLTRFGTELDFVWIVSDLKRGERLIEASFATYEGPVWTSDVPALLNGSLAAFGMYDMSFSPAVAAPFAGSPGETVNWAGQSRDGAALSGTAYWRIENGQLDLAITMAADSVYRSRVGADQSATLSTFTKR